MKFSFKNSSKNPNSLFYHQGINRFELVLSRHCHIIQISKKCTTMKYILNVNKWNSISLLRFILQVIKQTSVTPFIHKHNGLLTMQTYCRWVWKSLRFYIFPLIFMMENFSDTNHFWIVYCDWIIIHSYYGRYPNILCLEAVKRVDSCTNKK